MAKTIKFTGVGILDAVKKVKATGKYRFFMNVDSGTPDVSGTHRFDLSPHKALAVADSDECFPLGVKIKVSGRLSNSESKLNHVNIISVDGVEVNAWAERNASTTVDPHKVAAAQDNIRAAQEREDAMRDKAPPEQPGTITDPLEAYDGAMAIVRRQRKLKNPKLSQQEIWLVRDALNLLAEKLGIV